MIESISTMTQHHFHLDKLSQLSLHLEELFDSLRDCLEDAPPPELADEIAATAGEIMLLLADHGEDELVRETLNDARHLREVARTLRPRRAQLVETGAALTSDVARIIREEKRAA
ncbi:MAG TPA: hypothetical protein VEZ40_03550 [Pyrinomonadaceae bacterium]|nr:hypothetical protein [Pyrinomonadaceae bacterium]